MNPAHCFFFLLFHLFPRDPAGSVHFLLIFVLSPEFFLLSHIFFFILCRLFILHFFRFFLSLSVFVSLSESFVFLLRYPFIILHDTIFRTLPGLQKYFYILYFLNISGEIKFPFPGNLHFSNFVREILWQLRFEFRQFYSSGRFFFVTFKPAAECSYRGTDQKKLSRNRRILNFKIKRIDKNNIVFNKSHNFIFNL